MSLTGKCADCGARIALEAGRQIAAREGPYYDRWLAGLEVAAARRRAAFQQLETEST
jgi:hypothetical protein